MRPKTKGGGAAQDRLNALWATAEPLQQLVARRLALLHARDAIPPEWAAEALYAKGRVVVGGGDVPSSAARALRAATKRVARRMTWRKRAARAKAARKAAGKE